MKTVVSIWGMAIAVLHPDRSRSVVTVQIPLELLRSVDQIRKLARILCL